jgi:hypothetical protein
MIALLNLPKPSDELITSVLQYIETLQINNDAKKLFEYFQSTKINCSEGQIFKCPPLIYMKILKEFHPYINDRFDASIGIFKNTDINNLSYLPPHIDGYRKLALNYIISEGGHNTLTTMYKMNSTKNTTSQTQVESYTNLEIDFSVKTIKDNWYATDIQNFLSSHNAFLKTNTRNIGKAMKYLGFIKTSEYNSEKKYSNKGYYITKIIF